MLWFFSRDDQSLQLDTLYDNEASEFIARVRWPDGREHVERFKNGEAFRKWLASFETDLESKKWKPNSPVILPYGWPNEKLT
jgi:hypothetical protein